MIPHRAIVITCDPATRTCDIRNADNGLESKISYENLRPLPEELKSNKVIKSTELLAWSIGIIILSAKIPLEITFLRRHPWLKPTKIFALLVCSVTRWLNCFTMFGRLQLWKFAQYCKKCANVIPKYQIDLQKITKKSNFRQRGEILPNLVSQLVWEGLSYLHRYTKTFLKDTFINRVKDVSKEPFSSECFSASRVALWVFLLT